MYTKNYFFTQKLNLEGFRRPAKCSMKNFNKITYTVVLDFVILSRGPLPKIFRIKRWEISDYIVSNFKFQVVMVIVIVV